MKQIQKMSQRGLLDPEKEDPFSLFVASTDIRYCYYHDSHKILGNTYGMLVLQDFEALTPNLLARSVRQRHTALMRSRRRRRRQARSISPHCRARFSVSRALPQGSFAFSRALLEIIRALFRHGLRNQREGARRAALNAVLNIIYRLLSTEAIVPKWFTKF